MPARFKVDEDLPAAVADLFRSLGHDAATVVEQGWRGWEDARIWSSLLGERRILVTADKGFADLRKLKHASRGQGVILLRLEQETWRGYVALAKKLLGSVSVEALAGSLVVVSEKGIRIRKP